MALATNSSVGEIHLDGDFIDTLDAYNPQLRPTGVIPGTYGPADIVVDQKGRILYATTTPQATLQSILGDASSSTKGICQFGTNITDEGSGVFGIATASNTVLGVVKSGDTDNITITAGSMNVGTNVLKLDTRNVMTKRWNESASTVTASGSPLTFTPNAQNSKLFILNMTADATLAKITNPVIGDQYDIIIKTNGNSLTIDSGYKIRSYPSTPEGISVLSCVYVATDKFYSILQTDYQ